MSSNIQMGAMMALKAIEIVERLPEPYDTIFRVGSAAFGAYAIAWGVYLLRHISKRKKEGNLEKLASE